MHKLKYTETWWEQWTVVQEQRTAWQQLEELNSYTRRRWWHMLIAFCCGSEWAHAEAFNFSHLKSSQSNCTDWMHFSFTALRRGEPNDSLQGKYSTFLCVAQWWRLVPMLRMTQSSPSWLTEWHPGAGLLTLSNIKIEFSISALYLFLFQL